MTCSKCNADIPTSRGAAFAITAWEEISREGNRIIWKKRTGDILCVKCVNERKYGASRDQLTLV